MGESFEAKSMELLNYKKVCALLPPTYLSDSLRAWRSQSPANYYEGPSTYPKGCQGAKSVREVGVSER